MIIDDIYCNMGHFKWQLLNDNIIDYNRWHFIRFLNPCLFDATSDTLMISKCMSEYVSRMKSQGNFIQVPDSNPLDHYSTGVSLKGSRRNWQETAPGEEKVNQLFKTNYNKWYFNRLLKHVQQSIIQLYLHKVTPRSLTVCLPPGNPVYPRCFTSTCFNV